MTSAQTETASHARHMNVDGLRYIAYLLNLK
jgi:hypothetical protein